MSWGPGRRGAGALSGWLLAVALGGLIIFGFIYRDTIKTFITKAGEVVGSVEGAGGSP